MIRGLPENVYVTKTRGTESALFFSPSLACHVSQSTQAISRYVFGIDETQASARRKIGGEILLVRVRFRNEPRSNSPIANAAGAAVAEKTDDRSILEGTRQTAVFGRGHSTRYRWRLSLWLWGFPDFHLCLK